MIYNPFKSLRFRIFSIVFFTGLISCLVIHSAILESYEDRAVNVRESEVSTQLKILANHLINYSYFSDTTSEVINAELDLLYRTKNGEIAAAHRQLPLRGEMPGEDARILSLTWKRCDLQPEGEGVQCELEAELRPLQ